MPLLPLSFHGPQKMSMLACMKSNPYFPVEVIEHVIDSIYELYYDDNDMMVEDQYAMWKACALTCRAMVPRSQYWLFLRIRLSTQRQAENLAHVLRDNPAIGKHVQVLGLFGPRDRKAGTHGKQQQYDGWISWIPQVLAPRMKNLKKLVLRFNIYANSHPMLAMMITAFKSIQWLTVSSISFPTYGHCARLVRAFPHLRHLQLSNIVARSEVLPQTLVGPGNQWNSLRRVRFQHLDLSGHDTSVRYFTKWLSTAGACEALRTIYTPIDYWDYIQNDLLSGGGTSNHSLALYCDRDLPVSVDPVNVAHLRMLHLQMTNDMFPTRLLVSFLLVKPRRLRAVTIYLKLNGKKSPSPNSSGATRTPLTAEDLELHNQLDAALLDKALANLKITLCLYGRASVDSVAMWRENLMKLLPKLCQYKERLSVRGDLSQFPLARWMRDRDGF